MPRTGRILFATYASRVLERKRARAAKTFVNASLHIRRLVDFFGERFLWQVDEDSWSAYVANCRKVTPGRKLFDDRKWLNVIMNAAYFEGLVRRRVRLFIPEPLGTPGREISDHELGLLFQQASPELTLQMDLALLGLRLREMLRLRWQQIDWAARAVNLAPADTKTRRGRVVPLTDDLFVRLRTRFLQSASPFVFPSPANPMQPQYDNKTAWRRCKRKAGVRCRWHDFRHTCATRMLRGGATIAAVKAVLGMSEKVLMRIYQHLNVEDLRAAVRMASRR